MKTQNKASFNKIEFVESRKKDKTTEKTILKSQSNFKYTLFKENNLYYIQCNKSNKTKLIGDKEVAEEYILYGIEKSYKL